MNFSSYIARLEDTIRSRGYIDCKELRLKVRTAFVTFSASLHFYDGSSLTVFEYIEITNQQAFSRIQYRFHYQRADKTLIFRYDNSPHYPNLTTFPSHKHTESKVIAAEPPDLADVLHEIDALIYPEIAKGS